jgi:nitroimidazol reductase NimA-like FMN-containing flavoprotein (pyridoxamine 5'-phosphate oxidase superfamily)
MIFAKESARAKRGDLLQARYTQRVCADESKINAFLRAARVGVISIHGDDYPYAVPVNFVWDGSSIYFHGMGSGKKNDLIEKNPKVSFTVFQENGTVSDPVPCHADTSYFSVMIFGSCEKVLDHAEGAKALNLLLDKLLPGFYKPDRVSSSMVAGHKSSMDHKPVAVFKISVSELTAKENAALPNS